MKDIIKAILISVFVLATMLPFSCKVTEQGLVLVNTNDYKFPTLDSYYVTGEKSLRLVFSEKVSLENCSLTPAIAITDKIVQNSEYESGLCIYDIEFADNFIVGSDYSFFGKVTDRIGNSLTFSLPFTGFNASIPGLEITEIHPRYTSSKLKSGTVYKCEYVEILVTKGGNLAGLELYSANDGKDKAYKFPALEVQEGEIILLHLRTKGEGTVNELENDITLSTAKYSSPFARDLWETDDSARLGDTLDVILLRNTRDDSIIDAVCYASSTSEDWKNSEMSEAAIEAFSSGFWDSDSVEDAVKTDGLTATKSLYKKARENTAASWDLSKTSGETPGVLEFSH